MKRKAAPSIRVNPNIRALKIYPIETTTKNVQDLQTVGISLSKSQAIHLARVLLAVTQDWDKIDITAFRFHKRQSDNTYQVTVTSYQQ